MNGTGCRAWKEAVRLGKEERVKAARKAKMWSQVNGWLEQGEQEKGPQATPPLMGDKPGAGTLEAASEPSEPPVQHIFVHMQGSKVALQRSNAPVVAKASEDRRNERVLMNTRKPQDDEGISSRLQKQTALLHRRDAQQAKKSRPRDGPQGTHAASAAGTAAGRRAEMLSRLMLDDDDDRPTGRLSLRARDFLAILPPAPVPPRGGS